MDIYKRTMVHDIVANASAAQVSHAPAQTAAPAQNGWVGELEKLSQLRAAGHLSEAEYAAAKAKILSEKN